jgi:4-amino-4-deoxy-L-arabinose transferase-like glycosyltransferase
MTASIVPAERVAGQAAQSGRNGVAPAPLARPAGARGSALYRHRRLAVLGLFVLALLVRVVALDQSPPSLDPDEVSIGYNAWSIARTGKDEYGQTLPLTFRAFGEYKRPAYIYAAVPSLALLGPTSYAVRLPAALFGALAVPLLYGVAVLLLRSWRAGLCAALMLVLSPWHLQFTRAAREASLLVLSILLLAYCLLRAWHARPADRFRGGHWYVLAGLAFLLALYDYPGALVFAPLFVLVLSRAYWGRLLRAPRAWLGGAVVMVLVLSLPLALQLLDGSARERLNQASIVNVPALRLLSQQRVERDVRDGAPAFLNEPRALGLRGSVNAYLSHFNPTYLFTAGDLEWRHHASDHGQLLLWDLPLLFVGAIVLVRHWRRPAMQAIGAWLLIGPVAATFAENAPHAVRTIVMVPAWYLLAGAGFRSMWGWLRRRSYQWDWLLLLALSAGFYFFMLFRYYPAEQGRSWQSGNLEGYRAAMAEVEAGHYKKIVVPQEFSLSYVYALYATGYDPARYLAQGGSVADATTSFYPGPGPLRFDPFEVRVVNWRTEPRDPDVLFVIEAAANLPQGFKAIKVVPGVTGHDKLQLITAADGPAQSPAR